MILRFLIFALTWDFVVQITEEEKVSAFCVNVSEIWMNGCV